MGAQTLEKAGFSTGINREKYTILLPKRKNEPAFPPVLIGPLGGKHSMLIFQGGEEAPMLDSDGRPCSEYHVRALNVSSYCQPRPSISKPIQLAGLPIGNRAG
jgi:hypothetical protein